MILTAGYIHPEGELSAPGCRWEAWRESLCACMSARDHGLEAAAAAAAAARCSCAVLKRGLGLAPLAHWGRSGYLKYRDDGRDGRGTEWGRGPESVPSRSGRPRIQHGRGNVDSVTFDTEHADADADADADRDKQRQRWQTKTGGDVGSTEMCAEAPAPCTSELCRQGLCKT